MKIRYSTLLIALIVLLACPADAADNFRIRFATLATEGSTWINVIRELDTALKEQSGGRLSFRIYPGGVSGDELSVLRKMRLGNRDAAGFTGMGMGEILPEVRVLDSPFLFRDTTEVDHITSLLFDRFAAGFRDKGFILLGWADVGFVNVFANKPIRTLDDMKGVRMWMWEGDPVAEETFRVLGVSPFPQSIINVLPSLQTGQIDGVYVSPLACIALQWFTRVKYMISPPLAYSTGGVLLSRRMFDKMPPDLQKILVDNSREYLHQLIGRFRIDDNQAVEVLKKQGIDLIDLDPGVRDDLIREGRTVRRNLVGRLYSEELLDQVEKSLVDYRAAN
jgi:TRAP-type C4-dicarboxylate transport system substrate-binding protein